jgi:acetyl-CoA C-acetyltransferase
MADRPHTEYDRFMRTYATEMEKSSDEARTYYRELWNKGFRYPGVHSFRAGRTAANMAYKHASIFNPMLELDFIELHDAYTSSEIQTYEDMGLCRYGEGGPLAASGKTFMSGVDYGLSLPSAPVCPVNPSGGLIACGHPVGATGLMQAVFATWQLRQSVGRHFGDATLQIPEPRKAAIHSHAGTGTYITVTVLERE